MRLAILILLLTTAWAEAQTTFPAAVERYCLDCHDSLSEKGGIDLDAILGDDLAAHRGTWEKVVKQLAARHMPPVGKKRPDEPTYEAILAELTTTLDAQPAEPVAGPVFRRLTRTEYQNAVRDLLAVEFDAKAAFPTDEISHGFDNITVGDLSPALIMRLHGGEDSSRFPAKLEPGSEAKPNEKPTAATPGFSNPLPVTFARDWESGSLDAWGEFIGGTETMRLAARDGLLFAHRDATYEPVRIHESNDTLTGT